MMIDPPYYGTAINHKYNLLDMTKILSIPVELLQDDGMIIVWHVND